MLRNRRQLTTPGILYSKFQKKIGKKKKGTAFYINQYCFIISFFNAVLGKVC